VATVPFEEVSEEFAAIEGEGDGSLRYWREVHWTYFGRVCKRIRECQVRECQSSASVSRSSTAEPHPKRLPNLSIERAFNGGAHWPLDQAVGH
jgi:hypothetical protein